MARYRQIEREQVISTTRQQLISAAVEEIARVGYPNANINRISEAAGFAKGTIYNYFPSKQALMLAVLEELSQRHLAYIADQVREGTSAKARLDRFFEAGFAFVENYPAEAKLLISTLYGANKEFYEKMGKTYQPMFWLVSEEIITFGMTEGGFRQVNPVLHASILMTLYLGTCSQVDANGKPYLDPGQVAEFAFHALRKTD
jgi:AcrR family transcriptional regulator